MIDHTTIDLTPHFRMLVGDDTHAIFRPSERTESLFVAENDGPFMEMVAEAFMGTLEDFRNARELSRDGGNIIDRTDEGVLDLPARYKLGMTNTWTPTREERRDLRELDLTWFDIDETDTAATVNQP